MDLDEARAFIREHHGAVLATRKKSGGIQMTPVAAGVDAEGRVVISSREHAFKVRNMRRDPHASLLVLSDGLSGRWIQVGNEPEGQLAGVHAGAPPPPITVETAPANCHQDTR